MQLLNPNALREMPRIVEVWLLEIAPSEAAHRRLDTGKGGDSDGYGLHRDAGIGHIQQPRSLNQAALSNHLK